jgi:hypothetical protein
MKGGRRYGRVQARGRVGEEDSGEDEPWWLAMVLLDIWWNE